MTACKGVYYGPWLLHELLDGPYTILGLYELLDRIAHVIAPKRFNSPCTMLGL